METVLAAIPPSGELHLGNCLGTVRNWAELHGKHACFYCIVDHHAVTEPHEPADRARRVRQVAEDLLACGIDPAKPHCSCSRRLPSTPSWPGRGPRPRASTTPLASASPTPPCGRSRGPRPPIRRGSHRFFSDQTRQQAVRAGGTTAGIGCIDCKKWLFEGVSRDLGAIRQRAAAWQQDPARIEAVLVQGAARARAVPRTTMAHVRDRMGIGRPLPSS